MAIDPRESAEQRTVLLPRAGQAGVLPPGHALQEFVLQKLISRSPYNLIYLARDERLDRFVAIKEFLPTMLAMRGQDAEVVPRLPRFAKAYDKGLQGFMQEARLLGSFDHPALLQVFRFWAQNGTAYMAMPFYDGITLRKWLSDLGTPPSEAWLRDLLRPLMQALSVLHDKGCVHRDVEPDNILMIYDRKVGNYLQQAPQPVLLDFGAARRVIGDQTQTLTAILKSGYSPVEQYDGEQGMRQGTWTDVYALCAVLYTAVTQQPPRSAIGRVVRDEMPSARQAGRGRYSEAFLAAIDAGLAVRPEHRPAGMPALQQLLDSAVPIAAGATAGGQRPAAWRGSRPIWVWPALAGAALLLIATLGALYFNA